MRLAVRHAGLGAPISMMCVMHADAAAFPEYFHMRVCAKDFGVHTQFRTAADPPMTFLLRSPRSGFSLLEQVPLIEWQECHTKLSE